MRKHVIKQVLNLRGMTCSNCETRIERALRRIPGVRRVKSSYPRSMVEVEFDKRQVSLSQLKEVIEDLDYQVVAGSSLRPGNDIRGFLGFLVVVIALYLALKNTVGLNFFPQVNQSMGLGLLFLAGLLTSVHCLAMCGGIVLSQTTCNQEPTSVGASNSGWRASFSYNLGRVISYTLIGGLAGMLGATVSFSGTARGTVAVIAGILMLVIGLNMLGLFSWTRHIPLHMPRFLGTVLLRLQSGQRPLYIGLANGLMPCGPLQAMQLYALGTGSFLAGAGAMLVFGLGTVPLLFGFGALNSLLSQRFTRGMLKASAVLVSVLGLVMVSRGLALSGVVSGLDSFVTKADAAPIAQVQNGVQVVRTVVGDQSYSPRVQVLQKGMPVRWIVDAKSLNGCNNPITIPKLGVEKQLSPGENVIQFTPHEEGVLTYACWMGMITGSFRVVGDIKKVSSEDIDKFVKEDKAANAARGGGCCGPTPPKF